ncbi:MAG TPA: RNA 2'-phosphotransferase [Nitrososphaeraceae archaeon]|nr:RNA 2'-phosphotransferase [Nitrososphaeraceae archaeon]
MLSDKDLAKLSHILSYALRHNPQKYNLVLDREGWASISELLIALSIQQHHQNHSNKWLRHIEKQNLEDMIARSDKVRFEINDDKIRALYGHSSFPIPFTKIQKIASKPPDILYHGTSPSAAKTIMSEGLRPMNRQYVHLSTDRHTALQVGKRKTISKKEEEEQQQPVIIAIYAIAAYNTGVYHFYQASDLVWLSDYIHPNFMELFEFDCN